MARSLPRTAPPGWQIPPGQAPACLGVDVARLRAETGAILATLDALGPARLGEYDASTLPTVYLLTAAANED